MSYEQFFEQILAGDTTVWQRFLSIMEPELMGKFRRLVDSDEDAQSMAHDVILCFIANLPKIMGQEPKRTYIRPPDDRFVCTLSTLALKHEYQHTPLENITIDMIALDLPEPGVIIRLERYGPAKVLRHDRANVSYAGQTFESLGRATAALQDSWKAAPELATAPAPPPESSTS